MIVAFVYVFPYFPGIRSANELPRVYLVQAMAADGTFAIDRGVAQWGTTVDVSPHAGHQYSNKAPGSSMLAVPAYYGLTAVTHAVAGRGPTLGEMTWATFEHVANAPDCSPGGTAPIAPAPADPLRPGKTLPEWNLFDWTSYRAQGGDGARCAVPDGAYRYTVAADGQTLQNQTCGTPSATPLCNIDPRLASLSGVQVDSAANTRFRRINVCRTVAQPRCSGSGAEGEQVACLNQALADEFPAALADKWRYYALVGSVYMAGHAPGVGCFRYDDGPMLTTQPPRSRFPSTCAGSTTAPQRARAGDLRLANTSMETWMQDGTCLVSAPGSTPLMGRDCFACHAPATNEPGWPFGMGDMSFLFDRIPVGGPTQ